MRTLGVLREGILSKWRHLFVDGEYARREKILSGLTLEQVKRPPSENAHSIYEELWHATRWQTIVVTRDESAASAKLAPLTHQEKLVCCGT